MKNFDLLIAMFILLSSCNKNAEQIEFKTGFEAMTDISQLPVLYPIGSQTRQALAYDASGGNYDHHFLTSFSKYTDTIRVNEDSVRYEYVIFDEYGPGCLYRQQMNAWIDGSAHPDMWVPKGNLHKSRGDARIKYYFDNAETPLIDLHMKDFFGAVTAPFIHPFSFIDPVYIFAINYFPFCFQERIKVSLSTTNPDFTGLDQKWYQYTSITYPADSRVETWKGTAYKDELLKKQWDSLGKNPNNTEGCTDFKSKKNIGINEEVILTKINQAGSIAGISISVEPGNVEAFLDARLQITFDGNSEPSVNMSAGSFFGAGGKDFPDLKEKVMNGSVKNLLFGFDNPNGSYYSYWPMPFWKSAVISLQNNSPIEIQGLNCNVNFKPARIKSYEEDNTGYFMAKRTIDSDPDTLGYRSVAFSESGHGHVAGIMFYTDKYDMDGDEFTYIDDSSTPQIHGSGTEDDHNQGWAGRDHQKALWGGLLNGYQGAWRIYLNDAYIFYRNILIAYEYSLMKKNLPKGGTTDVVIYYYKSASGPLLQLTDEIDVGNHFSESMHGYTCSNETWSGRLTDSYDGYERNRDFGTLNDDGRSFSGTSSFTVHILPNNQGIKLRRRINRNGNGVQTGRVFVDGTEINERPWHIVTNSLSPGSYPLDGWFDSDYEIPAKYTQNKSQLNIEVRYLAPAWKNEINEFYYWVYSYTGSGL